MDPSQRTAIRMVIEDLVRERDNLSVTIATLNARLAMNGHDESTPAASTSQVFFPSTALPDEAIVSPGELVGMTSRDGAAHLLRKADRPLATGDLLRLLRRGGLPLAGLHAHNTLRRALDNDPRFYYAKPRLWAVSDDQDETEVRPSG